MGQEELDFSTIWVALGMARDAFQKASKLPSNGLAAYHRKRRDEMQRVRDNVEDRIRMLTELEEYDYGL